MSQTQNSIRGTKADDTLIGTGEAETLYGFGGNDILRGLGGDDILDGGGGTDRLYGGTGDDLYYVKSVADRVFESSGAGIDQVLSSARLTVLSPNVENLSFLGSAKHIGIGNGLANELTGSGGADHLFGKGGDDTLNGAGGNDSLSGGAGNDALAGGSGRDVLQGGAGNDFLDGETGDDRMIGGAGDDVYIVDNIRDRVIESVGGGNDIVRSSVDFRLSNNVETLILKGPFSADGIGNPFANLLQGNDQNNVLKGLGGNDTLAGGLGDDTLTGGRGADRFVFASAISLSGNTDTITDFSRKEGDKIALSLDIFADFDGTGRITADAFYAAPGATRATEGGQFLIYNTETGSLYYDAEGPGGRGPIEIAQVGFHSHPALNYGDFLIVA